MPDELSGYLNLAVGGSDFQWRLSVAAVDPEGGVRPGCQEGARGGEAALLGREVEGRVTPARSDRVLGRSTTQEDDRDVVGSRTHKRHVQGRQAPGRWSVDVGSGKNEQVDEVKVSSAMEHGGVQHRLAGGAGVVGIHPVIQEESRDFQIPHECGHIQRGYLVNTAVAQASVHALGQEALHRGEKAERHRLEDGGLFPGCAWPRA